MARVGLAVRAELGEMPAAAAGLVPPRNRPAAPRALRPMLYRMASRNAATAMIRARSAAWSPSATLASGRSRPTPAWRRPCPPPAPRPRPASPAPALIRRCPAGTATGHAARAVTAAEDRPTQAVLSGFSAMLCRVRAGPGRRALHGLRPFLTFPLRRLRRSGPRYKCRTFVQSDLGPGNG